MTKRYAIFGGGMAGLSAAWKITETDPDARVDVFECGWRLGGKLHSSESIDEPENREHGLHILFGFYLNAFHLLRSAYEELADDDALRFRSLDEAVEPQKFGVIHDAEAPPGNQQWIVRWPRNPVRPGTVTTLPGEWPSIREMGRTLLSIGRSLLPESDYELPAPILDERSSERLWDESAQPPNAMSVTAGTEAPPDSNVCEEPRGREATKRWIDDVAGYVNGLDSPRTRASCEPPRVSLPQARVDAVNPQAPDIAMSTTFDEAARVTEPPDFGDAPVIDDAVDRAAFAGSEQQAERLRATRPSSPEEVTSRRAQELADVSLAIVNGLRALYARTGGWDLDSLDAVSLKDWLLANGASEQAANSAFIDMYREAAFGYRGGRHDAPDFAAGAALRAFIRIFSQYQGCVTWKLVGGAGEVVIAPVFLALRRRGVRFYFFHRLERIGWDEDRHCAYAQLQRQALTEPGVPYEFLKSRDSGGVYWPDAPNYDKLVNGEALQAWGGRLDDPNQVVPDEVAPPDARYRLYAGEDQRYDELIVATGLGSLKAPATNGERVFAEEEPRTEKLRAAIDELQLVPTIAAQFGLSRSCEQMGWIGDDESPGISGMPRPLPIACDMTRAGTMLGTLYLCSAYPLAIHHLAPEAINDDEVLGEVRDAIADWCETHGACLSREHASDNEWNWRILCDPLDRDGRQRLHAQYLRLNNLPVETCIGCHSGTNLRLVGPGDAGLPNVTLAGAWTRTGLNLSSFEAAVMSGFRAARRAIGGRFEVPGEGFLTG